MTTAVLQEIYRHGIFFLSDNADYSYAAVCLADGLNQLGIPIRSNISYHEPLISDFAFSASPPAESSSIGLVVLDLTETLPLHNQIVRFSAPHPRTVVLCMHDNAGEICFPDHYAFCSHENRFRAIAGNRIPIAFGISSAMLQHSQKMLTNQTARCPDFLAGFRPSESQSLRASLDLSFVPLLMQHFNVNKTLTGTERWGEDYYRFLSAHTGCLAYGGYYGQNLLNNPWFHFVEPLSSFLQQVTWQRDTAVLRWDSWRFWESLVFGCATVHLDFEQYGFSLPVLPVNWEHYIGIRLEHLKEDVERIHDERQRLPEIGRAGREWAIRHYSPTAIAQRFINDIQGIFSPQHSCQARS
ncbi:hypothetical protein FY034_15820 [Trichlorobacter lovleyi]|uniref:hypothetical protein n=1 Tax=Trichlorobacter lovleyi TaxID=313985 RepID=UPI00223F6636|nr:hypothetical protein [Trichlorobacter lovleyi]QOX80341.1 hypothetical protein FY034_15820 [Trichlorobacter lovleyi]